MMFPDIKARLDYAVRAADRTKTRLAVALNNLRCARVDAAHARSEDDRARSEVRKIQRELRAAERREGIRS